MGTQFSTPAALFVSAPGAFVVSAVVSVYPGYSGSHTVDNPVRSGYIVGEDCSGQTIGCVIRQLESFLFG